VTPPPAHQPTHAPKAAAAARVASAMTTKVRSVRTDEVRESEFGSTLAPMRGMLGNEWGLAEAA
jgi:hypothetical protein